MPVWHAFLEKPVGVDAPGVLSLMNSGQRAKLRGLSAVVGFNRRYDRQYREAGSADTGRSGWR